MSTTRRIVAGIIAAYLLLVLADRFVLLELFVRRCGLPMLAACAVALAAIGAGSFAKRDVATRLLVGYPIFGAVCFLFGLIKASVWTLGPLVVVLAGVGVWRSWEDGLKPVLRFPWLLFLPILVLAQAPPSSLDELAYHLAIPHTWLLEGRAIELPLISHSYFPLGIESADMPLLAVLGPLSGGIASHFLHLLAAIAAAVVIQRKAQSLLVTTAILTTPALLITAGWSLLDFPLLGICAVLFDEDDERTIAAAIGAGLLTKYTFIPFALIVLLITRRWRGALWGAAIGSVFFLRNLVLTWDPIAPFFQPGMPRFIGYRGAPYLSDYVFDPRFLDEALGASLLTGAALATTLAAGTLAAFGVVLFLLAPSSRLLLPYFGVAAMTARPDRRWLRALIAIAVAVQLVLVVVYVERTGAFAVISGRLSDEEYLRGARRSYDGITWLNQTLPPMSRTLVVGLNETYWFERRVRGGGNFDGERVSHYLEAATPDALRLRLAKDGITHIAVFNLPLPTEVARKAEERQTTLSPAARKSVAELLDHYAASVTSRGDVTLFALR
jgi:hypothetical protein